MGKNMAKKNQIAKPNEIVFGTTTRAELDELIYGMLSVRIHNNMSIPPCFRKGTEGGIYCEDFYEYEKRKFGIGQEPDLDGYNLEDL